jgi:hypothetical protein
MTRATRLVEINERKSVNFEVIEAARENLFRGSAWLPNNPETRCPNNLELRQSETRL